MINVVRFDSGTVAAALWESQDSITGSLFFHSCCNRRFNLVIIDSLGNILPCSLGRHAAGSGCADIHGNNRVPNCRYPRLTVLRQGDPNRNPVPVPPSETEDVQSAEASKVIRVLS